MWRISVCLFVVMPFSVANAGQAPQKHPQLLPGKIVKVSEDLTSVLIRVGDAGKSKDLEYEIIGSTNFWGQQPGMVETGLYSIPGVNEGTVVWYQRGQGGATSSVTALRLMSQKTNLMPPDKGK